MSESPVHQLKRRASRLAAHVRPHHLAVAVALAAIGIGVMAVHAVSLPGPRPVLDGDRLHIQVVAPVEPEITPGSVMEVGDLVDGFEYAPPPRPSPELAVYAPYDEDFEVPTARPAPKRYAEEAVVRPPPQPEVREDDRQDSRAGRWFGFDAPERDYRAEREVRRAQREARVAQEREGRSVRWYRSDGRPDRMDRPETGRWRDDERSPYDRD